MAILTSDILVKLSTTAGAAGNSNSATSPETSLGKYIATTQLVDNSLNNLFSDVTGTQNAASQVDYQCLFVHNNNSTITWLSVAVWINSQVAGGATVTIGLDPTGVTVIGSSSAQAVTIVNSTTAPSGVTFSNPTSYAGGLSVGSVAAGSCFAVWICRTAANNAAVNSDGCTLGYQGDTTA